MRLIWICPQRGCASRKKGKKEREIGRGGGLHVGAPRGPGVCPRPLSLACTPNIIRTVCSTCVYIAKGWSFGGFSETLGMTSEARGSRTGNTDFSIARILADELPTSGVDVDARKFRREPPGTRTGSEERDRASPDDETTRRDVPVVVVAERRRSGDHNRDVENTSVRRTDLTWLQYTRYRPPRLPRRSFAERRIKRRAGDHPRIPFSSSQLQVLEDRYRRCAYLTRNEVVEMSATLRLPQSKIKIWFQNRRARQRKESLESTITAR
ncbi:LOW QUALITY PROTEIN: homeobox protein MSX-2 [Monomorium pharaonis]|uniref:LOW QUALITY PROTEIN: homeobox protein MSX-2 n=1 Tax=Monomorium pharaonis TaxID=307658 RepID=UPI001746758E|nr:LOW QUALITY PROTEIN: homeobox protein MSX-2 [Monomorium pharaonis]